MKTRKSGGNSLIFFIIIIIKCSTSIIYCCWANEAETNHVTVKRNKIPAVSHLMKIENIF